jgi:ketosteroid isomerase-like protein
MSEAPRVIPVSNMAVIPVFAQRKTGTPSARSPAERTAAQPRPKSQPSGAWGPGLWPLAKTGMTAGVLALLASSALAASAQEASPEAAVGRTLDAFHAAAAHSDFKAYFDLFTPDGVFIGTDAGERWRVPAFKAYAKAPFAAGKGWTYTPRSRHVTLAPVACKCVAYFDELLDSKSYGTSRGTGVLLKGPHGWKIAQYALTFPIPNDLAKDVTDRIEAYEAAKK